MFKVGDRVRRSSNFAPWAPEGYETTVTGEPGDLTYTDINGDEGVSLMHTDWELLPDGPVRTETVTKRRIVPGVYGRLRVNDEGKVGRVGLWLEGHYLNATELDDLAMVASQLAEALRDVD